LQPTTKTATFYKCNKAPQLADREPTVITGGVLGGGSSINFMFYSRPLGSDYDNWKSEGWTADELLPYMKKARALSNLS
jgi:alcohol oxidase